MVSKFFIFRAIINGNGIKGKIIWKQKSLFEPTFVNVSLGSVYTNKRSWLEYARDLGNIFISNLPPKQDLVGNSNYCGYNSTGSIFNPLNKLDTHVRGKVKFISFYYYLCLCLVLH